MLARSAMQLCDGQFCFVVQFDGTYLRFGAAHGLTSEGLAAFQAALPRPAREDTAAGRAVLRGAVTQIPDVAEDPGYGVLGVAEAVTYRSLVAVPMLRDGRAIGAIVVSRSPVGFFPERQVELLETFADQAVIAVENVRLFNELEARNRDLTATGEILRVISSSPTDIQPVLDAIAESAATAMRRIQYRGTHLRWSLVHLAAIDQAQPGRLVDRLRQAFPLAPSRRARPRAPSWTGEVVQVPDVIEDPEYAWPRPRRPPASGASCRVPYDPRRRPDRSRRASRSARRDSSPRIRSRSSRPSPIKRSSRSRTCACSRSSKPGTAT